MKVTQVGDSLINNNKPTFNNHSSNHEEAPIKLTNASTNSESTLITTRLDTKNVTNNHLPETGENNDYLIFTAATLSILASVGLVAPTNKRQDYM